MFKIVLLAGALLTAQNSPRVAILEQAGWAAIKAGQPQVAMESFSEAIKLDPKNALRRLGAGIARISGAARL